MEINGAACFKLDERILEACQSILLTSLNFEPVSMERRTRTNQPWHVAATKSAMQLFQSEVECPLLLSNSLTRFARSYQSYT